MKDELKSQINSDLYIPKEDSSQSSKVNSLKSENFSELSNNEGCRRMSTSAAMVGLAISVGATTLLFPHQKDQAMAAESPALEMTMPRLATEGDISLQANPVQPTQSEIGSSALTPPQIKHKIKSGETLWRISQNYQLAPKAIAAYNQISPKETLLPGQTLNIPIASNFHSQKLNLSPEELARQNIQNLQVQSSKVTLQALENSSSSQGNLTASNYDLNSTKTIEISVPKPETGNFSIPTENNQEPFQTEPVAIPVVPPSIYNSNSNLHPELSSQKNNPNPLPLPVTAEQRGSEENAPIVLPNPEPQTIEVATQNPQLLTETTEIIGNNTNGITPLASALKYSANELYQVKRGDTLNSIARRYGVSSSEIIKANRLNNPNQIKVNQQLVIPNQKQATKSISVAPVETIPVNRNVVAVPTMPLSVEQPVSIEVANSSFPQQSSEVNFSDAQSSVISDNQVQAEQDVYLQRLRSDIVKLKEQYQAQTNNPQKSNNYAPQTVGNSFNQPIAISVESVNPEWQSAATPRRINAVNPSSVVNRGQQPISNYNQGLVSYAPTNASDYNSVIQIPVGQPVNPELPILSPDQYLPDNPQRFNGYIWPTKGVLTSGYGRRWGRMHKGIDIAAPIGTPIFAAASGEVISAGWNSGGYGNLVKVRHPDGSITLYAHNSRILVRPGQFVEQGQQIAAMGSTGFSTGPHLHFEVHPNGQGAVNPMAFLPQKR